MNIEHSSIFCQCFDWFEIDSHTQQQNRSWGLQKSWWRDEAKTSRKDETEAAEPGDGRGIQLVVQNTCHQYGAQPNQKNQRKQRTCNSKFRLCEYLGVRLRPWFSVQFTQTALVLGDYKQQELYPWHLFGEGCALPCSWGPTNTERWAWTIGRVSVVAKPNNDAAVQRNEMKHIWNKDKFVLFSCQRKEHLNLEICETNVRTQEHHEGGVSEGLEQVCRHDGCVPQNRQEQASQLLLQCPVCRKDIAWVSNCDFKGGNTKAQACQKTTFSESVFVCIFQ